MSACCVPVLLVKRKQERCLHSKGSAGLEPAFPMGLWGQQQLCPWGLSETHKPGCTMFPRTQRLEQGGWPEMAVQEVAILGPGVGPLRPQGVLPRGRMGSGSGEFGQVWVLAMSFWLPRVGGGRRDREQRGLSVC